MKEKHRVPSEHTVGRPDLAWSIRKGIFEEVTFELSSEEWGRVNRIRKRRIELGREDANIEGRTCLGEGKECGVTKGLKSKPEGNCSWGAVSLRLGGTEALPRAPGMHLGPSVGVSPSPLCSLVGNLSAETDFTITSSRLPSPNSPALELSSPPFFVLLSPPLLPV